MFIGFRLTFCRRLRLTRRLGFIGFYTVFGQLSVGTVSNPRLLAQGLPADSFLARFANPAF